MRDSALASAVDGVAYLSTPFVYVSPRTDWEALRIALFVSAAIILASVFEIMCADSTHHLKYTAIELLRSWVPSKLYSYRFTYLVLEVASLPILFSIHLLLLILAMVVLAGTELRASAEVERYIDEANTIVTPETRIAIFRFVGDEASAALAMGQFFGWLANRVADLPLRILRSAIEEIDKLLHSRSYTGLIFTFVILVAGIKAFDIVVKIVIGRLLAGTLDLSDVMVVLPGATAFGLPLPYLEPQFLSGTWWSGAWEMFYVERPFGFFSRLYLFYLYVGVGSGLFLGVIFIAFTFLLTAAWLLSLLAAFGFGARPRDLLLSAYVEHHVESTPVGSNTFVSLRTQEHDAYVKRHGRSASVDSYRGWAPARGTAGQHSRVYSDPRSLDELGDWIIAAVHNARLPSEAVETTSGC